MYPIVLGMSQRPPACQASILPSELQPQLAFDIFCGHICTQKRWRQHLESSIILENDFFCKIGVSQPPPPKYTESGRRASDTFRTFNWQTVAYRDGALFFISFWNFYQMLVLRKGQERILEMWMLMWLGKLIILLVATRKIVGYWCLLRISEK